MPYPQVITDELVADIAVRYPKIGRLSSGDLEDEIAGRIIRDVANQELCEDNGWRYMRGQWCLHATDEQIKTAVFRWWKILASCPRP